MRPLLPSLPLLLLLALMGAGCADMTSSPGGNGPDDYAETLGDDDDDATVGDDDGEASGDDDDDDTGGSLPGAENVVLRTRPQPEARDFHYLDCLTVEFSDAYGDVPYEVTLATADGEAVELALNPVGPLDLEACPVEPLQPSMAYHAQVLWGGAGDPGLPGEQRSFAWNFETSELGGPAGAPPSGRFVLDPRSLEVASPSGLPEDLLSTLGAGRLLVEFGPDLLVDGSETDAPSAWTELEPGQMTFAIASESSTEGLYDTGVCEESMVAPSSSLPMWGDPELDSDRFDLVLAVFGDQPVVWDLELQATLSPDGSYLGGIRVAGLLDTRVLDAVSDLEDGATCAFWADSWGVDCVACPSGDDLCLEVRLRDGVAHRGDDLPDLGSADDSLPRDADAECGELAGCGCSAAAAPGETSSLALLALMVLLGARRRRLD